jgi:enoyl-CoA hydratase/carnithine racemase
MTNRSLSAHEAYEWGLVAKVVSQDALMEASVRMATEITRMPPLSIKAIKKAVNRGMEGYEYACNAFSELGGTKDAREGIEAFLEKREPHFKGE